MEMIMMDQAPAPSLLPTELPSLVPLLGGHDAQQMILVQVNPGETFTIQAEDGSLQCIQGPAHVPMVSTNGSIPPIHVPPGYISQIIEDNGLWKVVVTPHSPDFHPHHHSLHPGPPPLPPYMPHHPPPLMTPHPHPMYPAPVPPGTPGDLQSFMAHAPPPPHTIYEHDSLPPPLRQNFYSERSIGKLHDRPPKKCKPERNTISERPGSKDKATSPPSSPQNNLRASSPAKNLDCSSPLPPSHTLSGVTRPGPDSSPASIPPLSPAHSLSSSNDMAQPLHNGCIGRVASPVQSLRSSVGGASGLPKRPERKSRGSPRSLDTDSAGDVDTEAKRLSSSSTPISKPRLVPKLSNIQARSAVLSWSPPSQPLHGLHSSGSMVVPICHYEVSLCDVGRDSRWHLVYSGDELEVRLSDLRPASDYHARVQAICDTWRDLTSDPVAFTTSGCVPDMPGPPSLLQRTRTSLFLQWKAPADNGSRISAYLLQWDEGKRGIVFKECYHGNQKQCKMTRLTPAGSYSFRLAACNSMGTSGYSEEVSFVTAGTPPTPDPPRLSRAGPSWLTLHWVRPSQATHSDVLTYTLEMEEELLASSADGRSSPSDLATFWTSHDRPPAPPRPSIRGPLLPHAAVICWEPPKDYGMDILKYQLEMSHGHNGARWEVVYSGSAREYLCDHLKPGSHYQLRVLCHTTAGFSQSSEVLNVEIPAVPPGECTAPCLRAPAQPEQLELEWDAPEHSGGAPVLEYMLHMSKGGCSELNEEKEAHEVYRGPETFCTVGSLLPGCAYTFCVHAANFSGFGELSEIVELYTASTQPSQCVAPTVQCLSVDSARVTWEHAESNGSEIEIYRLEWGQDQDDLDLVYTDSNCMCEIDGLMPARQYYCRVQAANAIGDGLWSPLELYTAPMWAPGSISELQVVEWDGESDCWLGDHELDQCSTRCLALSWCEPASNGSPLLGFTLSVAPPINQGAADVDEEEDDEDAGVPLLSVLGGDRTSFVLGGFLPDTEYCITVRAVNRLGGGPPSMPVVCRTRPLPPQPPRLECAPPGPHSLKLRWGEGPARPGLSGDATHYVLALDEGDGRHSVLYSGPSHTYKVQRLQENTSYSFVIQACSTAGRGPFSAPYTYCTTRSPPPAPRSPRVAQLEGNRCQIHWDPVTGVVGEPVIYCLQVCSSRDLDFRQVYKGSQTSFQAVGLYYNCEYRFRVYAVRLCGGASGAEMAGPSSLPVTFLLRRKENVAVVGSPMAATAGRLSTSSADGGEDRARLPGDERFAALLLFSFGACSLFIAFIMQLFIM
uniref:Fibronectin type III domain containing 3Ba n=1 Tax=Eptatretus burgeri TaxID=7764 RepID=A0A8C4NC53_EPTBU